MERTECQRCVSYFRMRILQSEIQSILYQNAELPRRFGSYGHCKNDVLQRLHALRRYAPSSKAELEANGCGCTAIFLELMNSLDRWPVRRCLHASSSDILYCSSCSSCQQPLHAMRAPVRLRFRSKYYSGRGKDKTSPVGNAVRTSLDRMLLQTSCRDCSASHSQGTGWPSVNNTPGCMEISRREWPWPIGKLRLTLSLIWPFRLFNVRPRSTPSLPLQAFPTDSICNDIYPSSHPPSMWGWASPDWRPRPWRATLLG